MVEVIKGLYANKISDEIQSLKVAKPVLTNSRVMKYKRLENKREFEKTESFIGNRVRMCRLKRTGKKRRYESARGKQSIAIGNLYTQSIDAENSR